VDALLVAGRVVPAEIKEVPSPGEPRAILVVDDEERLRKALVRSLGQENCRALAAASGEEAVRILQKRKIDLVITDLVMPGMDGMTLVRKIKSADPSIEAIIITAYGSAESEQEAKALGVSCYLAKPFDLSHLKSKVNELLFTGEAAWASSREAILWGVPRAVGSLCSTGGKTLGVIARLSRMAVQHIKPRNVVRAAGGVAGAASRGHFSFRGLASVFKKREVKRK